MTMELCLQTRPHSDASKNTNTLGLPWSRSPECQQLSHARTATSLRARPLERASGPPYPTSGDRWPTLLSLAHSQVKCERWIPEFGHRKDTPKGAEVVVSQACRPSNIYRATPARGRNGIWREPVTSRPAGRLPWPHSHGTDQDNRTSWSMSLSHPQFHRRTSGTPTVTTSPSTRSATASSSHNNLSGSIPVALIDLQLLSKLDLSYNHLHREIPRNGVF
jgi:hypothetical protein